MTQLWRLGVLLHTSGIRSEDFRGGSSNDKNRNLEPTDPAKLRKELDNCQRVVTLARLIVLESAGQSGNTRALGIFDALEQSTRSNDNGGGGKIRRIRSFFVSSNTRAGAGTTTRGGSSRSSRARTSTKTAATTPR